MRDEDHGHAGLRLHALEFGAHIQTQPRIEIGQGLIEEQNLGFHHHRARQRNALLLPARKLRGLAPGIGGKADRGQAGLDLVAQGRALQPLEPEPEADIVEDRQMREQRIGLEDQSDLPAVGSDTRDVGTVEPDRAGTRR